jgi:hypothetical protein
MFYAGSTHRIERWSPRQRNDSVERLIGLCRKSDSKPINGNRLANDSQTARGRQQQASLSRDEHC